jgi:hypothetical protein
MKETDQASFNALLEWSRAHGGTVHPALEVYKDDVTGFSMRVKASSTEEPDPTIKPGEEVLACPLGTSLSFLNATTDAPILAGSPERVEPHPAFPPRFMEIQPHVIAHFYLMKQYLLGKDSFWYPYISTLPQPDSISSWSLPPFWPDEDFEFLEGTNAAVAAQEIQVNAKRDFKEARKILKAEDFENWQDYTRHLFNWAFSIFASRSFRPSLVTPASVQERELPKNVGIDDFSVLLPVYDIINHDIKANVRWSVDHQGDASAGCRFITFDSYKPGEQVFNTYGKKTNSELLLSYGFMLPETEVFHNDYVHLRKKESPTATNEQAQPPEGTSTRDMESSDRTGTPQPKKQPPKDFLVSLRPMNHPSSFVGQNRNLVAKEAGFDLRSEFSHVEDALVWDLCLSIVGGDDAKDAFIDKVLGTAREAQPPTPDYQRAREQDALRKVLSSSVKLPREVEVVVAHVKELLLAKLGMEYDKFCEADPGMGVDEEGNEVEVEVEPQTRNQEIALEYRRQVKKVLENAIGALVPDWKDAGGEE